MGPAKNHRFFLSELADLGVVLSGPTARRAISPGRGFFREGAEKN